MFNPAPTGFFGGAYAARAAAPAPRKVTRKDFTDRLGIPENCTQAELDAALDRIKPRAQKTAAAGAPTAARPANDVDALYALAWGTEEPTSTTTAASSDADLYAIAWGA